MARMWTTTGQYIDLPAGAIVGGQASNFTILFWFKSPDNAAGSDFATFVEEASTIDLIITAQIKQTGAIDWFYRPGGFGQPSLQITSSGFFDDGQWHWCVFVKRASNDYEAYIDGVSIGTDATTITDTPILSYLRFGNTASGVPPPGACMARYFSFKKALSIKDAKEIAYQSPAGSHIWMEMHSTGNLEHDLSGNGYHGTVTGLKSSEGPPISRTREASKWRRAIAILATTYTQNLAGSLTPTSTVTEAVSATKTANLTPTSILLKAAAKSIAGAITPAGVSTKAGSLNKVGSIAPSGAIQEAVSVTKTGALTPAGNLIKAISKAFSGGITPSGALEALKVILLSLAGSITPSGLILKAVSAIKTGSVTPAGTETQAVSKTLAGSTTPSGALQALRVFLLSLAGSITPNGAITKAVTKTLGGTLAPNGTLIRAVSKTLAGVLTAAGNLITSLFTPNVKLDVSLAFTSATQLSLDFGSAIDLTLSAASATNLTVRFSTV